MEENRTKRHYLKGRRKSPGRSLTILPSYNKIDVFRRDSEIGFECHFQSGIAEDSYSTSIKEKRNMLEFTCCKLLLLCMKFCMSLCLLLACIFIAAFWQEIRCSTDSTEFNIQISSKLTDCIIGQENSIKSIAVAVDTFKNDVIKNRDKQIVHVMWWVGSIGIGKTMTSKLLVKSLKGVHVIKHIISSADNIDSLALELKSALHCCIINVVIIDGYNSESDSSNLLLDKILYHMNYINKYEFNKYFCLPFKVLFIISGIYQSKVINEQYVHIEDPRDSKSFSGIAMILKDKFKLRDEFNIVGNTHVIPFLPLELPHLDKCILENLNERLLDVKCHQTIGNQLAIRLKLYGLSFSDVSKKIKENIQTFSYNGTTLLATGCKSITQKIRLILNSLNILHKP